MKISKKLNTNMGLIAIAGLSILISAFVVSQETWGFYGHRRINRMAVFTLPQEMIPFFKKNIEFITEHAVDPDKRRYATKHEAVRHYIDIDHWGTYPFNEVPRHWTDALMRYTDIYIVSPDQDTIHIFGDMLINNDGAYLKYKDTAKGLPPSLRSLAIKEDDYKDFFIYSVLPQYYEEEWVINCEDLKKVFGKAIEELSCDRAFGIDRFSSYGILPYHLVVMQSRLTDAFLQKDPKRILRLCAEMGHYIGDAHVPLHTTENYNGQLTNQVGIHAFWESRLPELFADRDYNFFVGKAIYIENPNEYYWDIVLTSHQLVDSVLAIERDLSLTFPSDKQFCFENRLDFTVRTQCKEYAAAFHNRLAGMVEERMTASVLAIGSSWYTAWVDAGQPDLQKWASLKPTEEELKRLEELEAIFKSGDPLGRKHE